MGPTTRPVRMSAHSRSQMLRGALVAPHNTDLVTQVIQNTPPLKGDFEE